MSSPVQITTLKAAKTAHSNIAVQPQAATEMNVMRSSGDLEKGKVQCLKTTGQTGDVQRIRGGGAGKDCFLGCIACFLCFECCEECCGCCADILCCPCEMCC